MGQKWARPPWWHVSINADLELEPINTYGDQQTICPDGAFCTEDKGQMLVFFK